MVEIKGGRGSNQYKKRGISQISKRSLSLKEPIAHNLHAPTDSPQDNGWLIRERMARDPNTPGEVLEALAHPGAELQVLKAALCNENILPTTIARLAAHPDNDISIRIATNHKTPPEILRSMAERGILRKYIAVNPACPVDVLLSLLVDQSSVVRSFAQTNQSLPEHLRVVGQV